jgi:hypothetical protein
MLNTTNTISKKSIKLKTIRRKFVVIILTTSTTLKNLKKITILKNLTTLKKLIKLEKIKIENI